jgi:hypothetical protein
MSHCNYWLAVNNATVLASDFAVMDNHNVGSLEFFLRFRG